MITISKWESFVASVRATGFKRVGSIYTYSKSNQLDVIEPKIFILFGFRIKSNIIELTKSSMFDCSIAGHNRIQSNDCVRLSSVVFD